MTDAYSTSKAAHFPDRIEALKKKQQPAPVHVEIILSDLCNQSCAFCAYRSDGYVTNALFGVVDADGHKNNNPNRMIPYDKVIEVLDDCAAMGVKAIQLTGGGEPTVHPQHRHVMRETLARGMDFSLVTNGVLLTAETDELLVKAAWVRVSLDAGTEETYAQIRRSTPGTFLRVLANIQRLARARDAVGSGLTIGVGFVVTPDNWLEVVDATKLARSAGADNIRISAEFNKDDAAHFEKFKEQARILCKQARTFATPTFQVFDRFNERVVDMEIGHPGTAFCGYQHFTTYIGGDQNVYRCCNTSYNERGLLGSLKGRRFRDLWESQDKRDNMASFDARGCERCQFRGINRAIDKLLVGVGTPADEPSRHNAFV